MDRLLLYAFLMLIPVSIIAQKPNLPITVTDGIGSKTLYLGLSPFASDGIDLSLGEKELPPIPPSGAFDARFIGTDIGINLGVGTTKDYRNGDTTFVGSKTHEIIYQPGLGTQITISWNFTSGIWGKLQDVVTGNLINITMSGIGSYLVSNYTTYNKLKLTVNYGFAGFTISGKLAYANTSGTAMTDSKVYLNNGTGVLDSVITDQMGSYTFSNKQNGSYYLTASSTMVWGGVNSTDALQIRRYLTSLIPFDSLQLKSADVNGSGSLNSTDALLIRRRITGTDTSFKVGDWVFENPVVVVNNSNVNQNIKCLCTGDVNGSFVPGSVLKGTIFK